MRRREFTVGLSAVALATAARAGASESDAAAGVRAALERGATEAVSQLGRADGFLGNPKVKIELPGHLAQAARLMRAMGQGRKVDELVTAMNRAAEAAVPEARTLFVSTIKAMSVEDALKIVHGGPTSATDFFAAKTRVALGRRFLPIVTRETEKLQLAQRYNAVAGEASSFGLVKGDEANIQQYVTAKALDGLYTMVGEEERKIRADPAGTGSALLKQVFGR
ncbi:MAG: DUF4197 domain-containing protein [Burkholderiales bacterium]|nr:DUF4197 family protein [Burkholderiales bacterium]MDE2159930.1 DUF4197 domain-containing protein [Burkholderiales bacterium]MDE2505538.1 DUF4197 domain-containing protein [Burkholderiales bacterium]